MGEFGDRMKEYEKVEAGTRFLPFLPFFLSTISKKLYNDIFRKEGKYTKISKFIG
jgi:hypothetical protein